MLNTFSTLTLAFFMSVWAQNAVVPTAPVQLPPFSVEAIAHGEKLLQDAIQSFEKVQDYHAVFLKQEKIRRKLRKLEEIELKFQKPFKLYMKWLKSPDKGMEVIYIDGENNNQIKAHLGGFLNHIVPTVNLDIHNKTVTHNNRHLITETGIGEFLIKYEHDFSLAKQRQEIQIVLHGEKKVLGRSTFKIEAILPESPDRRYYCYRSLVWFDQENHLPIKMEFYDFDNKLIERYAYKDLKLNPGLTPYDFDPKNEAYQF